MNFAFLNRPWKKRTFRILVWILGSLVTLYLLFFAWMNYAGAKALSAAQTRMQREGESLDFRALMTAPVPDERNFCAIPALKDISIVVDHDIMKGEPGANRKRLEALALPSENGPRPSPRPRQGGGADLGVPADLKAWADWLRKEGSLPVPPDSGDAAREVLAALSKHDALFAELAAGLNRPAAQWTPSWKTRELPDLIYAVAMPQYRSTQSLLPILTLRATAAARVGDASTARQSLLIALRLARASLEDPLLIGELVACVQAIQVDQALWEMCATHAGSAEDFRRLQDELAKFNFEAALLDAFRAELATGVDAVGWMKRNCNPAGLEMIQNLDIPAPARWWSALLLKGIPGGFFDMNAASLVDLEIDHIIKPLRDGGLRAGIKQGVVLEDLLKNHIPKYRIDKIFARLAMPVIASVAVRTAYTQCLTNQAIIACALERWFIEHHSYPDSLAALGTSLPGDPLTGKPMGYRKTSDGKYALWSIGVDGKDDGGTRQLNVSHPENTKFSDRSYKGDWVWSFQP